MKQYQVTGMSCAACQARVEKAVSKIPGVTECAVSLLTNSMGVDGDVDPSEIIAAVEKAGYEAKLKGRETGDGTATREDSISAAEDALMDRETPILKKRLVSSLGFLAVLMYFSMGHMMLGFPIPGFFDGNHVAMGIVQMILSAIIMIINKKFFTSGFKSLVHFAPNMDTLVAMGSMVSFCWSTAVLLKMTGDVLRGDDRAVMADMDSFYFEAAAMIVTLITVGKMLEAMSKGRTTDALKGLMKLAPRTAAIIVSGEEKIVPIDQVKKGDIFVVRPGENIPVDGVITEGSTAVDESALTGESIPVDKTEGDAVSAATLNREGFIKGEVTGAGDDTTLSQIIRMVSDAAATKAPIAKIADRISGIFVPAVLIIATAVTTIWILAGQEVGYSLARGISVLVISCPCALGLATPVAIMVGSGKGAVNGILFKTAESLEETGRIRIVALDKTGTVTKGEPEVTDIMAAEPFSREELLKLAYSLEIRSEHPLAKAVLAKAREEDLKADEISEFSVSPGNGLQGRLGDDVLRGGNLKFIKETVSVNLPEEAVVTADELAMDGKTCLYFAKNGEFVGIIAVADTIKEDSPEAIAQLHNMGIKVVMITGDNEKTAKAIGREAGVDDVVAGVLPEGKAEEIERLQQYGKVAMVDEGNAETLFALSFMDGVFQQGSIFDRYWQPQNLKYGIDGSNSVAPTQLLVDEYETLDPVLDGCQGQDLLGHARVVEGAHQLGRAAARRRGGLEDRRRARGQGRGDPAGGNGQREVPRGGHHRDLHGLEAGRAHEGRVLQLQGQLGVVAAEVDGLADLRVGLVDRLAGLGGRHLDELAAPGGQHVADPLEDGGALDGAPPPPGGARSFPCRFR